DGIRDFHVTGVQTCALPICTFFLQDLTAERSPPDIYHLPFPEGGSCFCPHVLILVLQGIEQRIARRFIRNLPESIDCSKAHLFQIGRASCRERGWIPAAGVA